MPIGSEGAVARQADDAHVMAEIFAAELRPDAQILRQLANLRFHLDVAEGLAVFGALRRQSIEIARRGELHGLEGELGRGAADHDGEVIGRTGGGAQRKDFLFQEGDHAVMRQHGGRLPR